MTVVIAIVLDPPISLLYQGGMVKPTQALLPNGGTTVALSADSKAGLFYEESGEQMKHGFLANPSFPREDILSSSSPFTFPSNEKPGTALTVPGYLDLENQRYPRRASEWVAVTRDCDHSRRSGVSSMVDWGGNLIKQHAVPKI